MLLVSILAARALDPPPFAFYLALVAVATISTGIWDAGVSTVLVREVANERTPVGGALRGALRLRLLTLPAWLVAAAAGFATVSQVGAVSMVPILLFGLASLLAGSSLLPLAILRGRMRFGIAASTLAVGRWSTAAGVLAMTLMPGSESLLTRLAVAHVIGEGVTLVFALLALLRSAQGPAQAAGAQSGISLRAALPYAANGLLNLAYNRLDVLLVAVLTSTAQLAIYAPASRIQDALYIVSGTTYVVAVPMLSRLVTLGASMSALRAHLWRIWLLGGSIAGVGAVVVFVFAEELIRSLLGPEYIGSTLPTRIIVWSMPLSVVGAPLLAVLVAQGRGGDTTRAFAAAFGLALILHLTLDWWMGATGAAIASLARDVANVAVAAYLVTRGFRRLISAEIPTTPATREDPKGDETTQ